MVGVSLLLATGIWYLGQKLPSEWVGLGVISLVLLYGVLTFNRNYVYRDELSFWGDVIQKSPDKARGYVNYAVKLHTTGEAEEAIYYYQQALAIDPDRLTALTNLGVLYTQLGEFDRAEELFDKALTVDPNYMDAINAKGVIYLNTGDFTQAKEYFDKVLAIDPYNNSAIANLEFLGQKKVSSE
jgi:tetratricopeptide (TPR) repeat protein